MVRKHVIVPGQHPSVFILQRNHHSLCRARWIFSNPFCQDPQGLERVFFGTRGLYLLLCWKHPEHDRFFHLEFSQILDDTCNVQLQNCFHRSDHSLRSHKGKDLPLMQKNRQLNKLLLQPTSPVSCAELKQLEKE